MRCLAAPAGRANTSSFTNAIGAWQVQCLPSLLHRLTRPAMSAQHWESSVQPLQAGSMLSATPLHDPILQGSAFGSS